MEYINTLIKPTNQCNMRCRYCFAEKYGYSKDILDVEKLKKYLILLSKKYDYINVIWHGGEPLMVSLDFYSEIYTFCKTLNSNFVFSLQTNGTLLNLENIKFFKDNNTNIGLSFDGLYNDNTRGNTQQIINNLKLLQSNNLYPGAILVVNQNNVKNIIEDYEYFKYLNLGMKINPMFVDGAARDNDYLKLNPDEYINSFVDFFKHWTVDKKCNINVSNCTEIVNLILNKKSNVCTNNSCLGKWLCFDSNGNIYPCDRLCMDEYKLGNIDDIKSIESVFESEIFINLLQQCVEKRRNCMSSCNLYEYCYGGCNANSILYGNNNPNISCYIHKEILIQIKNYLNMVLKESNYNDLNNNLLKMLSLRR